MKAIIKKKLDVATGTLYVEFDLLGEKVDFQAGQYFFVTLLNPPYSGIEEKDTTHHFSIVNSPNTSGIIAMTTRIRLESPFKRSLAEMPEGAEVEIGKIAGSFVLPENVDKPIVCIALGIGITPFMSMLRYVVEEKKDYKIVLIYSDDNTASMPFLPELQELPKTNPNFRLILSVTHQEDWEGEKRRVDGSFLKDYLEDVVNNYYFVSGPPKAVEAVASNLKETGIPEVNIKTDSFSGY